jgi:WD40 repeat protein
VRLALVLLTAATVAVAADREFSSPAVALKLGFSNDGKSVVGVCEDGVVRFWDAETGASNALFL